MQAEAEARRAYEPHGFADAGKGKSMRGRQVDAVGLGGDDTTGRRLAAQAPHSSPSPAPGSRISSIDPSAQHGTISTAQHSDLCPVSVRYLHCSPPPTPDARILISFNISTPTLAK